MLYILNTRRSLRLADSSHNGLSNSQTHNPSYGNRSHHTAARPIELGPLPVGGVQVRTQIETADTNYGVRRMFRLGRYGVADRAQLELDSKTRDGILDLSRRRAEDGKRAQGI
jgi:hypothetical protein